MKCDSYRIKMLSTTSLCSIALERNEMFFWTAAAVAATEATATEQSYSLASICMRCQWTERDFHWNVMRSLPSVCCAIWIATDICAWLRMLTFRWFQWNKKITTIYENNNNNYNNVVALWMSLIWMNKKTRTHKHNEYV